MEKSLNVTSATYSKDSNFDLLGILNRDRLSSQTYCDVILKAEEDELKAHIVMLVAHSTFFDRRLKNKVKTCSSSHVVLEFDKVTLSSIHTIIEYIYTGSITITSENVYDVVFASNYFEMPEVKKFCIDFMKTHLSSSSCLTTIKFARSYNVPSLEAVATEYLYKNFKYIVNNISFMELDLQEFVEIIHPADPPLIKVCESLIYEAIVLWVKAKEGRLDYFLKLFELVKLDKLKVSYLANHVAKEELVKSSLPCLQMLTEAFGSIETHHKYQDDVNLTDSQLQCKLITQRNLFVKYFKDESNESWFVVSSQWLNRWTKYVTNDGYDWDSQMRLPPYPGPIDSSDLFTNDSYRMLRDTVKAITDYKFVTEKAWDALVEWYGIAEGQPPINEKGPVLKKNKGLGCIYDETLIIDPVKVCFSLDYAYNKAITKLFSKWTLLSDAEKEIREDFNIPVSSSTYLANCLKTPMDSTKTFEECKVASDDILVLVRDSSTNVSISKSNSTKNSVTSVSTSTSFKFPVSTSVLTFSSLLSEDIERSLFESKNVASKIENKKTVTTVASLNVLRRATQRLRK